MATNEEEKGKEEVLGIDRLFKAREKALDTAKGDKLVKNFAEAMGLIAKLEKVTKLGEWAIGSAKNYTRLGDVIIDLMQRAKELVDQGENDKAKELFEKNYQQIVEQTFLEGGAGLGYAHRAAHRHFGGKEVELAIDHLIPNGREFIELGNKLEGNRNNEDKEWDPSDSDYMYFDMLIDLWIWAGKNAELRTKVEAAMTRILDAAKGEIERKMYDGNPSMEYERLRYGDFEDAGIMKKSRNREEE